MYVVQMLGLQDKFVALWCFCWNWEDTLTTPKKPALTIASFLAKLKTRSVFCVYLLTSDSSLPKALTVRMLLRRSSASYEHTNADI